MNPPEPQRPQILPYRRPEDSGGVPRDPTGVASLLMALTVILSVVATGLIGEFLCLLITWVFGLVLSFGGILEGVRGIRVPRERPYAIAGLTLNILILAVMAVLTAGALWLTSLM